MPWQSVQMRFTFVVVLVTSCVFLGFGYANYRSSQQERVGSINTQIDKIAARLPRSLANVLWELTYSAIPQIIAGEMGEPFLLAITVEADGKFVYGVRNDKTQIVAPADVPVADEVRTAIVEYFDGSVNKKVGTVKLYLSFNQVTKSLQRDLIITFLQFATLNLATIFGVVWALKKIVIRPIKELGAALSDVASGDSDLSMRLSVSHSSELAELTNSFNRFVEKLQRAMGGTLERVQQSIGNVARGDLSQDLQSSQSSEHSIMGRLAVM